MQHFFQNIHRGKPIQMLDEAIPISEYCPIDLSTANQELSAVRLTDPIECENYVQQVLQRNKAKVAYGGYLERRKLYEASSLFSADDPRNIHLGIDFWCAVDTQIRTPIDGKVHSFKNNGAKGDYGPTIILQHEFNGLTFHTLYGHLSVESLKGLELDKTFRAGEPLATIGATEINVNYAPHLHFQFIMDMQGQFGDYAGVCSQNDLDFFKRNCPDPNFLLSM